MATTAEILSRLRAPTESASSAANIGAGYKNAIDLLNPAKNFFKEFGEGQDARALANFNAKLGGFQSQAVDPTQREAAMAGAQELIGNQFFYDPSKGATADVAARNAITNIRAAVDSDNMNDFNLALTEANTTGNFDIPVSHLNKTQQLEASKAINLAKNTHFGNQLGLDTVIMSAADLTNKMNQIRSDPNIPVNQQLAAVRHIQALIPLAKQKEIDNLARTGLGAVTDIHDTNKQVMGGLEQILSARPGMGGDDFVIENDAVARDERFDQHFDVINGQLVAKNTADIARAHFASEGFTGDTLTRKVQEAEDKSSEYRAGIQKKLQEFLSHTGFQNLDVAKQSDSARGALTKAALANGADPEQLQKAINMFDLSVAAQFKLGPAKLAELSTTIANNTAAKDTIMAEYKAKNAVLGKVSELDFNQLKATTSGINSIIGALDKLESSGVWTFDAGDKANTAKEVRKLLTEEITVTDGSGGKTKFKPTEEQIALAMQISILDTWRKSDGRVDTKVLKDTIIGLAGRGIGDIQQLRDKYTIDQLNAISNYTRTEQEVNAEFGKRNLLATQRAHAEADIPFNANFASIQRASEMFSKAVAPYTKTDSPNPGLRGAVLQAPPSKLGRLADKFHTRIDEIAASPEMAAVLKGVMAQESGGRPRQGPKTDNFGKELTAGRADGYFQFRPDTAKQYNVEVHNLDSEIIGAEKFLNVLLKKHNNDIRKALAEYGGFVKADPTEYVNRILGYANTHAPLAASTSPSEPTGKNQTQTSESRFVQKLRDAGKTSPLLNIESASKGQPPITGIRPLVRPNPLDRFK